MIIDAIKNVAVALGYGSSVNDYTGKNVVDVLKEVAVKMECAPSIGNVRANSIEGVLNYIADNYGSEDVNPFDLSITDTNVTVAVERNGVALTEGNDVVYDGDVLKITATADEGYTITVLTVNGESIDSGDTVTVDGDVAIVATATADE